MKANVDALNIIQLGLALSDSQGNLPDFNTPFCYIWEFNFKDFDIHRDYCYKDSIDLLKRQGNDFLKNKYKRILSSDSGMMLSDLLFNYFRGLTWISFHSAYDLGVLLKIMTQLLSNNADSFIE
ncbi:hypothetical protein PVK06_046867 [Gossypium arboreum]|uniref:Uncharacterized protein n=1 Tax=Gossypium arboreum TaxID=29729 RepID=A0ABR0MBU6_GOSAR|nr:hypothetical protein PVK06_046867 [Gossypium arboreum]